jgi:hypothetical protein
MTIPFDFYCTVQETGGILCQTVPGVSCTVTGVCPAPPPPLPPPPPPPQQIPTGLGFVYLYEVERVGGSGVGFPAVLSLASAYDAATIRTEIAALAGLSESNLILRSGMFQVGAYPVNPLRTAAIVAGRGSMLRVDVLPDDSLRTRVCLGDAGQVPGVVADLTLPSEGGVAVVETTLNGHSALLAYKVITTTYEDFAEDSIGLQEEFHADLEANIQPSIAYNLALGSMSRSCE